MSTAIMQTAPFYDFGDLLLKVSSQNHLLDLFFNFKYLDWIFFYFFKE